MNPQGDRTVIIGGPMRGKSTFARQMSRKHNSPHFCTDTLALSRHPPEWACTVYMPEHITDWSEQSQHVADHWLTMPGPWLIEGVATARALRKWLKLSIDRWGDDDRRMPCDRIIVFRHARPEADVTAAQERMAKGVWSVWLEIAERFATITEYK